jgi:serine/threonine protein kinase
MRQTCSFGDLEGMHIGSSGSSMVWVQHGLEVDMPACQNFLSDDEVVGSLIGTPPTEKDNCYESPISPTNNKTCPCNISGNYRGFKQFVSSTPCLSDYTLLKVLGKGSFGKVILVRMKRTCKLYAVKLLRKDVIAKRRQVDELSVLSQIDSPFVIKLHNSFQCREKLYLVLEYLPGGELFFHLNRSGIFPQNVTRFYTAELVLALSDVHKANVVYRDLKPENVLLDHHGHIKLVDFGLCKQGVTSTVSGCNSLCGTPEYLAPEIITRAGHGMGVDWWALGMLVFEMLTGLPPWYTTDKRKLLGNLCHAPYTDLAFPPHVSADAKTFVLGLLDRNPATRLGSRGGLYGSLEVMQHVFFDGMDWDELRGKQTPVPIKPCKHMSEGDTSTHNFGTQFTSQRISSVDCEIDSPHQIDFLHPGHMDCSHSAGHGVDGSNPAGNIGMAVAVKEVLKCGSRCPAAECESEHQDQDYVAASSHSEGSLRSNRAFLFDGVTCTSGFERQLPLQCAGLQMESQPSAMVI